MSLTRYHRLPNAFALLIALTAAPHRAAADSPTPKPNRMQTLTNALAAFDRGNALLNQDPQAAKDEFRQARDGFAALVNDGVTNGKLYYNLANTQLRLGELGQAIAAYRQAQRLIPGDEQLRANLTFARKLRRDSIPASGERTLLHTLLYLHYRWPLRTRLTLALIAYTLFWIMLLARALRTRLRLTYGLIAALLVWVTLGVSVATDYRARQTPTDGVLTAQEVTVRKGDGQGYDPQFTKPLHEGVEFTVLQRRRGWVHIELPDGNRGWIQSQDAVLF